MLEGRASLLFFALLDRGGKSLAVCNAATEEGGERLAVFLQEKEKGEEEPPVSNARKDKEKEEGLALCLPSPSIERRGAHCPQRSFLC